MYANFWGVGGPQPVRHACSPTTWPNSHLWLNKIWSVARMCLAHLLQREKKPWQSPPKKKAGSHEDLIPTLGCKLRSLPIGRSKGGPGQRLNPVQPRMRPSRLLCTRPVSWNSRAQARYVLSSRPGFQCGPLLLCGWYGMCVDVCLVYICACAHAHTQQASESWVQRRQVIAVLIQPPPPQLKIKRQKITFLSFGGGLQLTK